MAADGLLVFVKKSDVAAGTLLGMRCLHVLQVRSATVPRCSGDGARSRQVVARLAGRCEPWLPLLPLLPVGRVHQLQPGLQEENIPVAEILALALGGFGRHQRVPDDFARWRRRRLCGNCCSCCAGKGGEDDGGTRDGQQGSQMSVCEWARSSAHGHGSFRGGAR
uniref:Uncharacterized protein n=1 Tax=Alexandrium andersonii TaxID=327968 RepID=A0A7S2GNU4_9DINO